MIIVNCIPDQIGWTPIQHMVSLAARLLDAPILDLSAGKPAWQRKALAVLRPRRAASSSKEACLFVCTGAADLAKIVDIPDWRHRFGFLAAWVIDSFWVDHIPKVVRLANPFDHLFITSIEDVPAWQRITRCPITWLPWGSDVLDFGGGNQERPWDLTRVGRQPPQWEDDQATADAAGALGIRFRGRPESKGLSAVQNFGPMMEAYRSTKFTLAFSNRVNSESYTHPTREYLTGRWVDSLACGSTVAGVAPRSESATELLWPGATLDLGGTDRPPGLEVLARALRTWTPQHAAANHAMALRRLDWRWRLKAIAQVVSTIPPTLADELQRLNNAIVGAPNG